MRRAVLFTLLLAACGRTGLSLPDAAGFTAARDDQGRLVVAVTRDGRVRHASKDVTLDELAAIVEEDSSTRVALRVDADAIWCHVQWVFAIIAKHSLESVDFVVQKGGKERSLVGYADQDEFNYLYAGFSAHVVIQVDGPVYRIGKRTTKSLRQLRTWIKEVGQMAHPAVYTIEGLKTPAVECLKVLNEFHEAGEKAVLLALEAPHPWVCEQRVLPRPREDYPLTQWVITDLSYHDITAMSLPVALKAAEDKDDDPDDRLIIELDKHGHILWRSEPKSLKGMRKVFDEAKRVYNLRQKAKGKSGHVKVADEREWSRLFVLLRADKDTPWLHVKWILSLLEEESLFRLQFAVMKFADLRYTEDEAKALGATRRDEIPWVRRTLDGKLQCFLPTAEPGPDDIFIDVDLETTDLKTARKEIERQ